MSLSRHGSLSRASGSFWFVDNDGYRVVIRGWDTPLYRFAIDDELQKRLVAVSLRQGCLVRQHEVAAAFGHSVETQRRWEREYAQKGTDGLRRKASPGRPSKVDATQLACITRWFKDGISKVEMAARLGISEGTVRNILKRQGLETSKTCRSPDTCLFADEEDVEKDTHIEGYESVELRNIEQKDNGGSIEVSKITEGEEEGLAETELREDLSTEASATNVGWIDDSNAIIRDPLDRALDRFLAALGLLSDATPAFANVEQLPRVGVLIAIPLFVKSGTLDIFRKIYQSMGPAFYGLRTTVVCLFVLALLRVKRPESVKEYNPQELGRLLGLDRAPEVKTIRRKLDALASRGEGMALMRAMAEHRAREKSNSFGVLYVDGHVKEYHGEYETGKAFISRRRLAAPAATDTWVNDIDGEPFFVVQSEANEGLCKTLEPVLAECRQALGPDRSITVVFDRGGWSPQLFRTLLESGYHLITYRRGHFRKIPRAKFLERVLVDGDRSFVYELHDAPRVRVGKTRRRSGAGSKYLWMRQVTRLRNDQYQTAVITDRTDLLPEQVLYLMFNRWSQENFFKYMREEFELDALLQYGSEPLSREHDRPNPALKRIDKSLRQARAELKDAEHAVGKLLSANDDPLPSNSCDFRITNADIMETIEEAKEKVMRLVGEKAALPKRISTDGVAKLKRERDLIANVIKMSAYVIEGKLRSLLHGCYARNVHEGRTLVQAVFHSSGRIDVTDKELRITLAPQSSPHRTRAVAELCEKLNHMNADFPGTHLRLVLAVEGENRS